MSTLLITISADAASDSWGFVGVVKIGDVEAYRTLESFHTPSEAEEFTRGLVGGVLGELLAGVEWRHVRDQTGAAPTRRDYSFGLLQPRDHGTS